jgi:hypothetical protein
VLRFAKPAYHLQVYRYHSKYLADGELSANLQICNIADDVFGRETLSLNSCFAGFYSRQYGKEANSCAKRVTSNVG